MKNTFIQLQNELLLKAIDQDQELFIVKTLFNMSHFFHCDIKFMNYKQDSLTLN